MIKFGNTSSAVALATQIAIDHNLRILLVSTGLNDNIVKDCFWTKRKKRTLDLFSAPSNNFDKTGVEGLNRIIKSNKVTPDVIQDYTSIVLTNRLDVLLGVEGNLSQYDNIKNKYVQIITLANQFYDMVIVDLDKNIGTTVEQEILNKSDIVVAVISQREKQILNTKEFIENNKNLNEINTVYTISKYMDETKYNAKNISRNLLKLRKTVINTIPYNNLFFEASQEGKVVDLFLSFMRIKDADPNYVFLQEIRRLYSTIKDRLDLINRI